MRKQIDLSKRDIEILTRQGKFRNLKVKTFIESILTDYCKLYKNKK
jgi:hypothetical protein